MVNTKFKVGDKVKVRDDLVSGKEYGTNSFVEPMEKYKGKVTEVEEITGLSDEYILLGIDGWNWTDEMLMPYKESYEVEKDLEIAELKKEIADKQRKLSKLIKEERENDTFFPKGDITWENAINILDSVELKDSFECQFIKQGDSVFLDLQLDADMDYHFADNKKLL